MNGSALVDTQKLQGIKAALQDFNASIQDVSAELLNYLSEKEEEVKANLREKMEQFDINETYRKQAENCAEEDKKAEVAGQNNRQRQHEIEELNDLKTLIRTFGNVSDELKHHLNLLTGTYGQTVDKGAAVLGKCIRILDEYSAVVLSSSTGNSNSIVSNTSSSNSGSAPHQMREYAQNWESTLTSQQKEAINDYTKELPPYYKNINGVLRGTTKCFDAGNEERSELIHQALSIAKTPCDITVYRGCSNDALGIMSGMSCDDLVGNVFEYKGYASTSMSRGLAFGGDLLLEIHLPKGSPAANIERLSAAGQYEEEVLIDRGQLFRVVGAHTDGSGRQIIEVDTII